MSIYFSKSLFVCMYRFLLLVFLLVCIYLNYNIKKTHFYRYVYLGSTILFCTIYINFTMYLCSNLSFYLSFYISFYLSIYLSFYLSFNLSIYDLYTLAKESSSPASSESESGPGECPGESSPPIPPSSSPPIPPTPCCEGWEEWGDN